MTLQEHKRIICQLIIRINQLGNRASMLGGQDFDDNNHQFRSASDLLARHKLDYLRAGGLLLTHKFKLIADSPVNYEQMEHLTDYLARMLGNKDAVIASIPHKPESECEFNILFAEPFKEKLMSLKNDFFTLNESMIEEVDFSLTYIASLPTLEDVVQYLNSPASNKNMV
ncbi:hypothetical protein [Vibrio owensii]|uniref:hypothetical protein n=1 Tax=Vibrio harveyi group TaxID=717610 RepID=UPI003CC5F57E